MQGALIFSNRSIKIKYFYKHLLPLSVLGDGDLGPGLGQIWRPQGIIEEQLLFTSKCHPCVFLVFLVLTGTFLSLYFVVHESVS